MLRYDCSISIKHRRHHFSSLDLQDLEQAHCVHETNHKIVSLQLHKTRMIHIIKEHLYTAFTSIIFPSIHLLIVIYNRLFGLQDSDFLLRRTLDPEEP